MISLAISLKGMAVISDPARVPSVRIRQLDRHLLLGLTRRFGRGGLQSALLRLIDVRQLFQTSCLVYCWPVITGKQRNTQKLHPRPEKSRRTRILTVRI